MPSSPDYIYSQADLDIIEGPFTTQRSKFARSLEKRAANLCKFLSPQQGRLRERVAEVPLVIAAMAQLPPNSKVADIGGASSLLPLQLTYLPLHVHVFDFRNVPFQHPNLTFTQGDLLEANLPDNSFDAVSCISVIEHVGIARYGGKSQPDRDLQMIAELQRITKPQGSILISAPYGQPHNPQTDGPPQGFRIYDANRLQQLCQNAKIKSLKFFTIQSGTWLDTPQTTADQVRPNRPINAIFFAHLINP